MKHLGCAEPFHTLKAGRDARKSTGLPRDKSARIRFGDHPLGASRICAHVMGANAFQLPLPQNAFLNREFSTALMAVLNSHARLATGATKHRCVVDAAVDEANAIASRNQNL